MTQTILVVDDEPEIVRLVRSYLEQEGYRVVIAYDGEWSWTS
jgi:DNA-binding response OmpR family regulator